MNNILQNLKKQKIHAKELEPFFYKKDSCINQSRCCTKQPKYYVQYTIGSKFLVCPRCILENIWSRGIEIIEELTTSYQNSNALKNSLDSSKEFSND